MTRYSPQDIDLDNTEQLDLLGSFGVGPLTTPPAALPSDAALPAASRTGTRRTVSRRRHGAKLGLDHLEELIYR